MALFMRFVPPARADGLSVGVGTPPRASAIAAVIIGVVALVLGLGPAAGVCAIALMAAEFALLAWLCVRQIGGQTGDVLGALEQIGEIVYPAWSRRPMSADERPTPTRRVHWPEPAVW